MSTRDFLFEIGTEELPPKALSSLSAALEQNITAGLQRATLEFDASRRYATPRRLAVMDSQGPVVLSWLIWAGWKKMGLKNWLFRQPSKGDLAQICCRIL